MNYAFSEQKRVVNDKKKSRAKNKNETECEINDAFP